MRWYEIFEYKTKSGDEITIKVKENIDGDHNRGWIMDKFSAYVNGEYAGYLRVSYIPLERFKKHYPTILSFMTKIVGSSILPAGKGSKDYHDLDIKDLQETVKNLSYHSSKYHGFWDGLKPIPDSREELIAIIDDIIKKELKEEKEKLKQFYNFHVDKPMVDYIRVFDKGAIRSDDITKEKHKKAPTSYQRQRIATALYLEVGEWFQKKGLHLYASDIQSAEAIAAWKNLDRMGYVRTDGKRQWIDIQ